jgi:hypothetical protein
VQFGNRREESMAGQPLRKVVDRWFRCIEEDRRFLGKVEYRRQRVAVPGGGYEYTDWKLNRDLGAHCPHDPFGHHVELVEE